MLCGASKYSSLEMVPPCSSSCGSSMSRPDPGSAGSFSGVIYYTYETLLCAGSRSKGVRQVGLWNCSVYTKENLLCLETGFFCQVLSGNFSGQFVCFGNSRTRQLLTIWSGGLDLSTLSTRSSKITPYPSLLANVDLTKLPFLGQTKTTKTGSFGSEKCVAHAIWVPQK